MGHSPTLRLVFLVRNSGVAVLSSLHQFMSTIVRVDLMAYDTMIGSRLGVESVSIFSNSIGSDTFENPGIANATRQDRTVKLEEVQHFIYRVLEFMKGYHRVTACGCGLSMRVAPKAVWDKALETKADLTEYKVEDVNELLEKVFANTTLTTETMGCAPTNRGNSP